MNNTRTLPEKMVRRADRDNLPESHPLRIQAAALEALFQRQEFPEPRQILGAWARARRAWCNYTGEALL